MTDLGTFVRRLEEVGGRALHLSPGLPPWVRSGSGLVRLAGTSRPDTDVPTVREGEQALPKDAGEKLLKFAPRAVREAFERAGSADFAAAINDHGRFRIQVSRDAGGVSAVVRPIPAKAPTLDDIGAPAAATEFVSQREGLVLVAGRAGSGKTTTLAACVEHLRRTRDAYIVTVESPVEFMHEIDKEAARSLVRHREVGTHCESFARGCARASAEGADVILLGRVPDAATASAAFDAAMAGCLVLAEVNARDSISGLRRLLGLFSEDRPGNGKDALASCLVGCLAQALVPLADPVGRGTQNLSSATDHERNTTDVEDKYCVPRQTVVPAFEVLPCTPNLAAAIRDGGSGSLSAAAWTSRQAGTRSLDAALVELVAAGTVDAGDALAAAVDGDAFRALCAEEGIALGETPDGADESESCIGPDVASSVTRRMSRAEMYHGSASSQRSRSAGRSRTAVFADAPPLPAEVETDAGPSTGDMSDRGRAPEDEKDTKEGSKDTEASVPVVSTRDSVGTSASGRNVPDPRLIGGRSVLVVDDDEAVRKLLVRMLRRAGARVKAVAEPREALSAIEAGAFDLAMFDILMPDISGTELYDRAVDISPALRDHILFVTGHAGDANFGERIARRGGRILRKPFGVDELLRAAAATLGPANGSAR